jgi:protein-tyrosine phosphatase
MPSILFVCTANQCRSPVAAALLRRQVAAATPQERWQIESAGTWAAPDRPADRGMQQAAHLFGLDLSGHRSQPVNRALVEAADLVLTMEAGQQEALQIEFPAQRERIYLLSQLVGRRYDIEDPIGGPPEAYAATIRRLERMIEEGSVRMQELADGRRMKNKDGGSDRE